MVCNTGFFIFCRQKGKQVRNLRDFLTATYLANGSTILNNIFVYFLSTFARLNCMDLNAFKLKKKKNLGSISLNCVRTHQICVVFEMDNWLVGCMVFNAVFKSISVLSRRPFHLSMLSWSSSNQLHLTILFPSHWLLSQITIVKTMDSLKVTRMVSSKLPSMKPCVH